MADESNELRLKLQEAVPLIIENHFRSITEQREEYAMFIENNKNLLETSFVVILNDIIDALFLNYSDYREYLTSTSDLGYEDGMITVQLVGQNISFVLELSKNLHAHIHNACFGIIERYVEDSSTRLGLYERVVECCWTRFVGFARGYIASKDQQIDYLHTQKISVMGQMAAGMAHEIRNPLASIKGIAQLVKSKLQQPDFQVADLVQYLSLCVNEIDSINDLVSDFLLLARKNEPSKNKETKVDIKVIVERIASITKHLMIDRDISLVVDMPDADLRVIGVSSQLEQVFLNIIKNSMDAVSSGGIIHIAAEIDASTKRVVLHFCDNGKGMPVEIADRIFEPFFTTKDTGTGIGLAICKQIIENHNGYISIESEENKGTNVKISLLQA